MIEELRIILTAALQSVHPRVYFQAAEEDSQKPYLVYDIPPVHYDGEGGLVATVDVDGWDESADTTALERLMASVRSALDKKTFQSSTLTATLYLDRYLSLVDDEPCIKRRKAVFQARCFEL